MSVVDVTNLGEVAQHCIVECFVGKARTSFFVHRVLLAHKGGQLEPIFLNKELLPIGIPETDVETFKRFVEYLYMEDYAAAGPKPRTMVHSSSASECSDAEILTPSATQDGDICSNCEKRSTCSEETSFLGGQSEFEKASKQPYQSKKQAAHNRSNLPWKRRTPSLQQQAWEKFVAAAPPGPAERIKSAAYSTQPNGESTAYYGDVFLSHAKIYIFAAEWDIEDLQKLSLRKLHGTLVDFSFHSECADDIAILLQHVYQDLDSVCNISALKATVIDYVACHVEKLAQNTIFQQTMKDSNEAAVDLIHSLLSRLDT